MSSCFVSEESQLLEVDAVIREEEERRHLATCYVSMRFHELLRLLLSRRLCSADWYFAVYAVSFFVCLVSFPGLDVPRDKHHSSALSWWRSHLTGQQRCLKWDPQPCWHGKKVETRRHQHMFHVIPCQVSPELHARNRRALRRVRACRRRILEPCMNHITYTVMCRHIPNRTERDR